MALLSTLDRLIRAGGTGVTLALWGLSIVGGLGTVYGPLSGGLWIVLTGIPLTLVWMRFLDLTIAELLVRIGLSELRYRDRD